MSYRVDKFQTRNWVKSDFEFIFDPKVQGRQPRKTTRILTKLFCFAHVVQILLS